MAVEGVATSIISHVSLVPLENGLYTARSGTVRLPLQSADYCDTPLVLWLPLSTPFFFQRAPFRPLPASSLPSLLFQPLLCRLCEFFFLHPPMPLSRQAMRVACIPAYPLLADGRLPFHSGRPDVRRDVDAKIIYIFLSGQPHVPRACRRKGTMGRDKTLDLAGELFFEGWNKRGRLESCGIVADFRGCSIRDMGVNGINLIRRDWCMGSWEGWF